MDSRHTAFRIRTALSQLMGTLLPSRCQLCTATCNDSLCDRCVAFLPTNSGIRCECCDLPMTSVAALCPGCLIKNPSFHLNISAFLYQAPINSLVMRLKNNHEHFLLSVLGPALLRRIEQHYRGYLPEVVTSVPLHWTRRLSRGYNQSALLARHLGSALNLPYESLLTKTQPTAPQHALNKMKRHQNLKNSFRFSAKKPFNFVALVDDVMTTKATAETATRVLLAAGVQRVDTWTLARTPL